MSEGKKYQIFQSKKASESKDSEAFDVISGADVLLPIRAEELRGL